MRKIPALLMIIVLIVGLFLMRESRMTPLDEVDKVFVDWLAANTARNLPPPPSILVEINDSSLEDKHSWPWSPLDFALFLQAVLEFEPKVVAIEPVLAWDQPAGGGDGARNIQFERSLDEFILRTKSIVLGAELGFPPDPDIIPVLQPTPFFRRVRGDVSGLRQFTAIEREPKEEYRVAPQLALGFVNLPSRDEVTRMLPLVFSYRGAVVPSFVLQAVMLSMNLTPEDVSVDLGSSIELANKLSIPINRAGEMRVDFGSPLTRFGFDDLLLAVEQVHSNRPPIVPPAALRGKIVLLARTDKDARTLHLPSGRDGSPGELFAAAIATIQNGAFTRRVSPLFDLLIIAILTMLGYFLVDWSLERVVATSLIVFIFYLLVSMAIFGTFLLWFPVLLPAGLILTLFVLRLLAPRLSTSHDEAARPAGNSRSMAPKALLGKGKQSNAKTMLEYVEGMADELIVSAYREIYAQGGQGPSPAMPDTLILEIYSKVVSAFREASKERRELLEAGIVNRLALYFLENCRTFGPENFALHLQYELENYRKSGLRPDYQRPLKLFPDPPF